MKLHSLEKQIVLKLNGHKSKILDVVSSVISNVLILVFCWLTVAIATLYFDFIKGIFLSLGLAIVFVLHFVVSEGIFKWGGKHFSFERSRPYRRYPEEIRGIGKKFADSSFPSSHVASMVGGLFILVSFYPAFLLFAIIIALIMGWSRLRNGMHYPSDILAGMILGLVYGTLALEILKRLI